MGIILSNLYDVSLNPSLPTDLKAKKVNLKDTKSNKLNSDKIDNLLEQIEDCLYDEGLIDLDEEPDD
jgi:hypothetical protein